MSYTLNRFPGAFTAYSLRKINTGISSTTANDIIQITRINDNETLSIGFTSSGDLDTNTISAFCTGTTCKVIAWYDQSKNNIHLYQNTLANAPIIYENEEVVVSVTNGKPALKFDGNQWLASTSTYTRSSRGAGGECFYFLVSEQQNINLGYPKTLASTPEYNIVRNVQYGIGITNGSSTLQSITLNLTPSKILSAGNGGPGNAKQVASIGGELLSRFSTLTPLSDARNIVIGSQHGDLNNRGCTARIQEFIYYRSFKMNIKNELESELNSVYKCVTYKRSRLDTIGDSFDRPIFSYALRITGSEKSHPTPPTATHTTTQFNSGKSVPLLKIRRGANVNTSEGTVHVFPDIKGELSLNSKVTIASGSYNFTKPIATLGEYLGNPYYISDATHYNAYVEAWYDQSNITIDAVAPSTGDVPAGNLVQTTLSKQPQIYSAETGSIIKINGKPAIKFSSSSLLVSDFTTIIGGNTFINSGVSIVENGFLNNTLLSIEQIPTNLTYLLYYETNGLENLAVGISSIANGSKAISKVINSSGSVFTDLSKNALTANTQYLVSAVRNGNRHYTTADGTSDSKTTVSGSNIASETGNKLLYIGDRQSNNTGASFYVQELSHFQRNIEAYKFDIEEEIQRYYKISSLNTLFGSVPNRYPTNLKLVYALRKITSKDNVALIGIRRSSDNAEVSVFPDFEGKLSYESPISTNTLGVTNFGDFCAGSDCLVTKIFDQGPDSKDLVQTTAANQPIIYSSTDGILLKNLNPAIEFDGVNDFLAVEALSGISTSACAVEIVATANTGDKVLVCAHNTTLANSTNRAQELRYWATSTHYAYSTASSPFTHTPITMSSFVAGAQYLGTVTYSTTAGGYYLGRSNFIATSTGNTTLDFSINTLAVGCVPTGTTTGSLFWGGTFQELIVWGQSQETNKTDISERTNDYYKVF